jgi:tRNA G26 N,N-dimethylase Trm1
MATAGGLLIRAFKGTRGFNIEHLGFIVQTPDGEYRATMAGVPAPVNHQYNPSTTVRWAGPLWLGPLHDHAFLSAMYRAAQEDYFADARRFLTKLNRELDELPIVYSLPVLADRLNRFRAIHAVGNQVFASAGLSRLACASLRERDSHRRAPARAAALVGRVA